MPDNTEIDQSENQTMIDMAKANAKRLKENVMGTEEQNKAAAERQKKAAEKYPDSAEAKAKALMGFGLGVLKNAKEPIKKAKGGAIRSSASKRADGCAIKGKTRGKMV